MHARVAEPENMERHATSPISYVLALNNSKHQLLHNYTVITELYSNILKLIPYSQMSKNIWYTVIMNRSRRTAGHLRVSDLICIVMHMSQLKTNNVVAENKCMCQPFGVIRRASIFMYTKYQCRNMHGPWRQRTST